jgi:hypothetical protein
MCSDEKSYTNPIRLMDQTSKGCTVTSISCYGSTSAWWCRNLTGISGKQWFFHISWETLRCVIAQHRALNYCIQTLSSIEEMIHMKTNRWRRKVDHSPTYIWHSNIKKWVMVQVCLSETLAPMDLHHANTYNLRYTVHPRCVCWHVVQSVTHNDEVADQTFWLSHA